MKKRMILFFVLIFMGINGFSQMMVIDMQAIASSIQNGITMGNQLQAAYNQLRTTYEQVENQIKNMQSMDLTALGAATLTGLSKNSQKYLNLSEDLESAYKKKSMKVGNIEFSLEDICTTNVYEAIKNDYGDLKDIKNLTTEQAREFFKKYGIEYERFVKLYAISQEMSEKSKEIKVKSQDVGNTVKELVELAGSVADNITGETSQTAVLQKNALVASQSLTALSQTLDAVSNIGDILASQYQNEMIAQEEKIASEMALKEMTETSPEYMKNSVGDESNYYGFGNRMN